MVGNPKRAGMRSPKNSRDHLTAPAGRPAARSSNKATEPDKGVRNGHAATIGLEEAAAEEAAVVEDGVNRVHIFVF